jgi:ammonium transporter, Amt family
LVIATGLFASVAVNSAGVNGLFYGNPGQLGIESFAIVVVAGFTFRGSYALPKVINVFAPIRVSPDEEEVGLDTAVHGE